MVSFSTSNEFSDIASTDSIHKMKVAFIMRVAVLFFCRRMMEFLCHIFRFACSNHHQWRVRIGEEARVKKGKRIGRERVRSQGERNKSHVQYRDDQKRETQRGLAPASPQLSPIWLNTGFHAVVFT